MVRYDNERGKGDHRHLGNTEEPYEFSDIETLVADFLADVSRALAKALGRDYKNVHRDVTELLRLGLIEKNEAGRILVPWDEIDAHLDLAA